MRSYGSVSASEDTPITIVLADDHAVVRSGLRMVLEREGGFEVVSEAGDADAALRTVLGHKPTVLVLDLNMPGELTSLDAIPRIADHYVSILADCETPQAVQEVGRLQRLTQLDSGLLRMTDAARSSTELVHGLLD